MLLDRQAEFLLLQLADLVAQAAGLLEFEIGGGGAHAAFQLLDIAAQIVADHVRPVLDAGIDRHLIALRQMADDIGDVALDRRRA